MISLSFPLSSTYFTILMCFVNLIIESSGIPNTNFGRYCSHPSHNQYMQSSDSELKHAVDDERCKVSVQGNGDHDKFRVKQTKFGRVKGKRVYLCDGPGVKLRNRPGQQDARFFKSANVFLGIPYAQPPTRKNNLQFKPPQDPISWTEIDTFTYKPSCPQHERYLGHEEGFNITDEDCLYLNIFVPDETTLKKYAVMMYIHGGNWDHGTSNIFPGHMLAASQEVVVVTFNYRLGYLGFLATANNASPGNYGILDQIKAIEWVKQNIQYFDGDPEKITLFGIEAGAASASLLAMSPLSKSKIKRVIAQSGAAVADWAVIDDPLFMINTTRILGEELGCSAHDSLRFVECVGQRSKNEIRISRTKPSVGWLPWGPVVDNFTRSIKEAFLPQAPVLLLKDKGFRFEDDFTYLTGVAKDEGAMIFLEDCDLYKKNYVITKNTFGQKLRDFMALYNYSVNSDSIFNALNFMYMPSAVEENKTLLRQGYIDLLTDKYYNAPNDKMVKLLLQKNVTTYMYVLNYTFEGYKIPSWPGMTSEMEYLLVTGAPFMDPKFYPPYLNLEAARWTEADRNMSQFFMQAWSNFAKEGNPTPTRLFNTLFWKPASPAELVYLNLNATNSSSSLVHDYRQKQCQFWNCYLGFLIGRETPTLPPTLEPGVEELRLYSSALWGSTSAAILFLLASVVCCILYCRIRRQDSY